MYIDGLYDLLLDAANALDLQALAERNQATLAEVPREHHRKRLIEALQRVLPEALEAYQQSQKDAGARSDLALLNGMLRTLRTDGNAPDHWPDPVRVLTSIHQARPAPVSPQLPLSAPWLFAASQGDPNLMTELRKELASADQVDILVSFIKWSGLRRILDVLEQLTAVGADGTPRVRIRILTTTYTGATELKALDTLARLPGVQVRVSLDGRRTRLHAKAWILERRTGFGTAFVGSANLTGAALAGGLEWTLRFTQAGQEDLFESARAHFETLWLNPEFEPFDPRIPGHVERLTTALRKESGDLGLLAPRLWLDLDPKPYQQEMLDQLASERAHGRTRNLLVAATGTGKTVVAALDYRALAQQTGGLPRLLFVAHRKEILLQAMATYRQALRTPDFGELLADGHLPSSYDHLFATIQSLGSQDLITRLGPGHWHMVVIDECHHIVAASFEAFTQAIQPAILLGLTATPERADGQPIWRHFHMRPDGAPAVELRLWDALDRELLAPFEYYGITDSTDFTGVRWNQPANESADLANILDGNDIRATKVIQAFQKYVSDPAKARVLGFCVSVKHAEFMAKRFNDAGIPSAVVVGTTDRSLRDAIPGKLARRELTAVFTCDLYNEGVDLPDVDTLLLLRPTQSPVLFQQQIGRGLRLAKDKPSCLILDFIGRYQEDFRFDRILQGFTGLTKRDLIHQTETGFPSLPGGCHLQFDRIAKEQILNTLKKVAQQSWRRLAAELGAYRALGHLDPHLGAFLRDQALQLEDVYRVGTPTGWTQLRRQVGVPLPAPGPQEEALAKGLGRLIHADDPEYLKAWKALAAGELDLAGLPERERAQTRLRALMLGYQVFPHTTDLFDTEELVQRFHANPAMAAELMELADLLEERTCLGFKPLPGAPETWPLCLHAGYQQREILTAVGYLHPGRRAPLQAGLLGLQELKMELLFVTLDKREGYHEGIAYHDYALSPDRFHWQTQNSAGPHTPGGRRYLESRTNGWRFQMFVRQDVSAPYHALGPVTLIQAEGDRPMSIQWQLEVPMPMAMYRRFSVLRGA